MMTIRGHPEPLRQRRAAQKRFASDSVDGACTPGGSRKLRQRLILLKRSLRQSLSLVQSPHESIHLCPSRLRIGQCITLGPLP